MFCQVYQYARVFAEQIMLQSQQKLMHVVLRIKILNYEQAVKHSKHLVWHHCCIKHNNY